MGGSVVGGGGEKAGGGGGEVKRAPLAGKGLGADGTTTAGLGQGGPAGWDARGVSAPLWSLKATGGSQAQD